MSSVYSSCIWNFAYKKIIEIKMEKDAKSIIGKMFNFNLVKIISHYEGKIINNQKEIERIV